MCQVSAQEIPTLTMDAYKRIDKPARNEVSGIVKNRFYENTFWVHGDSGTPNRIYAINEKGEIISTEDNYHGAKTKGVKNIDWEDIAIGEHGTLILADIGNNCECRKDLKIHVIEEPSPDGKKVEILKSFRVTYPEREDWLGRMMKWNYNAEAIFYFSDIIYVLTKQPNKSHLFKLENPVEDKVNELIHFDVIETNDYVTASDISADGKEVAVLTYNQIMIFKFDKKKGFNSTYKTAFLDGVDQVESITFNKGNLIIAEENGHLYTVNIDQLIEVEAR
jgi:hypothetical protein